MKKEVKTIVYDEQLHIEAYRFEGFVDPFPKHFHDFYVIGLMEGGNRWLNCKDNEYSLVPGDIILFNPNDRHACAQKGDELLNYRAINISKDIMEKMIREITGTDTLPYFRQTVIRDENIAFHLRHLHESIMNGKSDFSKEENFYLLIETLLTRFGSYMPKQVPEKRAEIEKVCAYIEEHFATHISLDELCNQAGLSKATLLRVFPKEKGVTPYLYLQNTRIIHAKRLLLQGISPIEVAMQTGFTDQSHFTNYFSSFIGLTPGAYMKLYEKGQKHNEE